MENYSDKNIIFNKSINYNIKTLNDQEMNSLIYDVAIIIDKRTFFQYYFSLLKRKNLILFTFFLYNDYNLVFIKIALLLLSFSLYLTINSFFFTDESMHKITIDNGDFDLIFQIPQIIYSTVISVFINILLKKLSLSESHILSLKKVKNIKHFLKKSRKMIIYLRIKMIFFFILSFTFSFFFWYFISGFCAVYKNTQLLLIKNSILSFGLSILYPFGLNLIPAIFRIQALRSIKSNKKCLYKFSLIVALL